MPVDEITEISLWNKQNELINDNHDLTFEERIAKLENYDGYMHLASGLSCSVKNKIIENFTIEGKYLTSICDYSRADIITYYGKPTYELIEENPYGGYSFEIESYILVYQKKKLNISTHPKTGKIIEISTHLLDVTNFQKK